MQKKIALAALAAALTLAAAAARADVSVTDPWVRGVVKGQTATGAFMTLQSSEETTLIKAASPVAGVVQIHEMKMDGDMMKMRPVKGIDLPAGKAVELKPGGYHVMLMDLKKPLAKGETVPITLTYQGKGGAAKTLEVKAEVRDLTASATSDKMQHDMHDMHGKHDMPMKQ